MTHRGRLTRHRHDGYLYTTTVAPIYPTLTNLGPPDDSDTVVLTSPTPGLTSPSLPAAMKVPRDLCHIAGTIDQHCNIDFRGMSCATMRIVLAAYPVVVSFFVRCGCMQDCFCHNEVTDWTAVTRVHCSPDEKNCALTRARHVPTGLDIELTLVKRRTGRNCCRNCRKYRKVC